MPMTKEELIEDIITGLDINFSDSKEVLLSLAKEALDQRTVGELSRF